MKPTLNYLLQWRESCWRRCESARKAWLCPGLGSCARQSMWLFSRTWIQEQACVKWSPSPGRPCTRKCSRPGCMTWRGWWKGCWQWWSMRILGWCPQAGISGTWLYCTRPRSMSFSSIFYLASECMKQDYLGGNLPSCYEKCQSDDLVQVRRGRRVFSKVSGP